MKLDMIGIITNNMEKSIDFYQLLDFNVTENRGSYVELNNDGVRISLNTVELVAGVYDVTPRLTGERIELAFLCENSAAVDMYVARVQDHGYSIHKAPWDAFWGQHYAVIVDPDGNLLSLFAN